jgi:uncharacterized protein (TIGR03437 family)
VTRPVASVAAVSNTAFARFVQPVIANANQLVQGLAETATVELVDVQSGRTLGTASTLERPLSTPMGNQRANVSGRTMAVDSAANTAYILTTSGLSVVPLEAVNPQNRPLVNQGGVVNVGNRTTQIGQGSLVSINGRNLAGSATASIPYPTVLGGSCVTVNDQPIPLISTGPGQISAQLPPALAAGRYQMVVRSIDGKLASPNTLVTVSKYAPVVLTDGDTQRAQVFHAGDQRPVTKDNPAKRDRPLFMYAIGLGPTKGGAVVAGQPAPTSPAAVTDPVEVFFGDPRWVQSEVIVDWSGLVPGFVGLYQLNLRVPGFHISGPALPVTVRIGGVSSPSTGSVPQVAVD